jgi:hypothetical protein
MKTSTYQEKNVISATAQKQSKGNARIVDNRPEAMAQRKLAEAIQKAAEDEEEPLQGEFIQRAPEDEEELQGKFIQRAAEDEEELQGKFVSQRVENKTGMPDSLKAGVEQLSGLDMSDVRVHYSSPKPAQVQAHAYTQGTNIHVAPGKEQYLGHEAWHVAQQKQGRVQPTTTVAGMPVNDNPGLEHEADAMGAKASSM